MLKKIEKDFIDELAIGLRVTRSEADRFLRTFKRHIYKNVREGYRVYLSGFGWFGKSNRHARIGYHPLKGTAINIPALVTVKFRAGETFKQAIK